jgi:hypothetical protein
VKRAAIVLGLIAILVSSCGEDAYPPALATTLQDRVVTIRDLAEEGRPGDAIAATRNLIALVTARMEAGRLDQGRALEILAAADLVVERLAFLPRPSAESPSPPPREDEEGGPGEGKGKDEGEGQGRGEDGNNGGGNDD